MLKKTPLIALILMLSACFDSQSTEDYELPEVNDENCKTENIMKIENIEKRQEMGSACFRRTDKPNPITGNGKPKSW